MHIRDILSSKKTSISFEFFPPRTEDASALLLQAIRDLVPLHPSFVSVTYGAGGSTRDLTQDLVVSIQSETGLTTIPHLTCISTTQEMVHLILRHYANFGIHNIMALRGDPQNNATPTAAKDEFAHAVDLVAYIKKHFSDFGIGVAGFPEGHPECPNRLKEMDYLKAKVDAGADYICTQLFFENRDFYDFCERCELAGIRIPIIAGIMPVTSIQGLQRMSELAAGARFPARLLKALKRANGNKEAVANVGVHWATEQVRDLLDNDVKGIHFYTLNRSNATKVIYRSLGVTSSDHL